MNEHADPSAASLDTVEGWFDPLDQVLFAWFLEHQRKSGVRGHLLELGAYMGKSAILLGGHLREGERLFVCDLFGDDASTRANQRENERFYTGVTEDAFLANYRRFHATPPTVIKGDTSLVHTRGLSGACRFVHVDASHQYGKVRADIGLAEDVLTGGPGIAAFDDYRSPHTPGVALAVWEAVLNRGLNPVCCSRAKLYGTWGEAAPTRAALAEAARGWRFAEVFEEDLDGRGLLLVKPHGRTRLFAPLPTGSP
ncbi:class I SAM-dependent methyltransferase [Streptomyces iconiensis]|uniref:Class I SAM-dependent methyltransferase n=1 Tax=Streptomyces iconiensis TaxID=1384038 RepID=A0ABT7A0V5_9ACTN|nr:class I SAM-dependent methyltransferase [Streptomyces iconiensis]MDJ1134471.1 class I SAM-dependent methyltransferase [Streptomyces iconiensis]